MTGMGALVIGLFIMPVVLLVYGFISQFDFSDEDKNLKAIFMAWEFITAICFLAFLLLVLTEKF